MTGDGQLFGEADGRAGGQAVAQRSAFFRGWRHAACIAPSHASLKQMMVRSTDTTAIRPWRRVDQPKESKKRAKGNFGGIKLSIKIHRSTTDPDALLARKSNAQPAHPSYLEHVLMDNRKALIVDCQVTQAEMRRMWPKT